MRNVSRIFHVVICFIACNCNPDTVPLKSKYVDHVTEIKTGQPADSIWSDLNFIFTSNGLAIKRIDKNKGLIQTKEVSMDPIYTFENKDGQLEQPQAWVVLARTFNKEKEWKPKTISGQWSIQVTETKKGETTVSVDPIVICIYYPNPFTKMEGRGQSTGSLEKLLEDNLKRD